jgi:hypothetical protein
VTKYRRVFGLEPGFIRYMRITTDYNHLEQFLQQHWQFLEYLWDQLDLLFFLVQPHG